MNKMHTPGVFFAHEEARHSKNLTPISGHPLTHPLFLKLGVLSEKGDKSATL